MGFCDLDMGLGSLWGLLSHRKGYGVGIPMGFWLFGCGVGGTYGGLGSGYGVGVPMGVWDLDMGSGSLWGLLSHSKGYAVGIPMGFAVP